MDKVTMGKVFPNSSDALSEDHSTDFSHSSGSQSQYYRKDKVANPGNVITRNAVAERWTGKCFHLLEGGRVKKEAVTKLKSKTAQDKLRAGLTIIAAQDIRHSRTCTNLAH
jgi:hypothetical protein